MLLNVNKAPNERGLGAALKGSEAATGMATKSARFVDTAKIFIVWTSINF